jgi:hypothetical protein
LFHIECSKECEKSKDDFQDFNTRKAPVITLMPTVVRKKMKK